MKTIVFHKLPPSKTNSQIINRMKRYGGFFNCYLTLNGKFLTLNKLKALIKSKEKIIIGNRKNPNFIKCGLYTNDPWDTIIPKVVASNHRRFVPGTRFDYGYMLTALNDNYCISYNFK